MSIVFVPRSRRRLRGSSKTRLAPNDPESKICNDTTALSDQSAQEIDGTGVVRVGYTVRPRHSTIISNLLVAVRRKTGDATTASDIIRLAIDQVGRLSIESIVDLLAKQEKQKRTRR